jgi:hypothetical protein
MHLNDRGHIEKTVWPTRNVFVKMSEVGIMHRRSTRIPAHSPEPDITSAKTSGYPIGTLYCTTVLVPCAVAISTWNEMGEQLKLLVQFEHRATSPSIYLIPQLCHLPTPRHLAILSLIHQSFIHQSIIWLSFDQQYHFRVLQ